MSRPEASLSEQQELTERLLLLRQLPVLRDLPAAQLAPIALALTPVQFGPGEALADEADAPRSFFLIRDGRVRGERRGRPYGAVEAPASVGLFPMLARGAFGMRFVAETEVRAYRVDEEVVHEVFEDHFSVLLVLVRGLADALIVEFQRTAGMADDVTPYFEPVRRGAAPLSVVDKIAALRRMRPFAKASVASLARLAVSLDEVHLPAGEVLWRRGDPGDYSLLLLDGEVEQAWEGGSSRVVAGFVLGGAEAVSGVPRSAMAKTVKPTLALRGTRAAFVDAIEDSFDLAIHFVAYLASAMMEYWDLRAEHGDRPMQGFAIAGLRTGAVFVPTNDDG
ncbi:MAG: cyclic nucleotide-binding domain-containing protein [Myxococcales bacterium]|nr:cyclic nucleotide-binding domain-containing protein [Myxococcales bacterium]